MVPKSQLGYDAAQSVAQSQRSESSITDTKEFMQSQDDMILGSGLPRGRLSIICIKGTDFDIKVGKNRTNPYIKFRVGASERNPSKATKTQKKQDKDPSFENELITFDILDPSSFISANDLQLIVEVWNKGNLEDELLGVSNISLVRLMKKPFRRSSEIMPMFVATTVYGTESTTMKRIKSKLTLEFLFEEARIGLVAFTLFEAKGLRFVDPMGQQDPYVQFCIGGSYQKRSSVIKNGGSNPYFAEEEVLMWVDENNWVNDVQVDLYDDHINQSKEIGGTNFSLLPYANPALSNNGEDTFALYYKVFSDPNNKKPSEDLSQGELIMKVKHYPAGILKVFVDRASDLKFPESDSMSDGKRIDPYVSLSLDGKAIKTVKRTPADKDGGSGPTWGCEVAFDVVDQYLIDVEVFHQNILGSDISLGICQVSLLPAFRTGSATSWSSLQQKSADGGIREVGNICLTVTFNGPTSIAYPQLRPGITAFDDSDRKRLVMKDKEKSKKDSFLLANILSPTPSNDNPHKFSSEVDDQSLEFTENEIIAAFKFIDLDQNNYIGAKEIRHILICMGELITDEEVDMMISMIDMDGDGQVSFIEFRTLVLHPNPHLVDLHKKVKTSKAEAEAKDKMVLTQTATLQESTSVNASGVGLDYNAFQRQKEMTKRESKKKLFLSFVTENDINFDYVKSAYQAFLDFANDRRIKGHLIFDDFCAACSVEPLAEYRRLFGLFDNELKGDVDYREFLLSLLNFVTVEKEVRIRFSFAMFDEKKSGFITQKEVEEILRGNHMISLASVQRKADTIMRQAKSNASGAITMNEFVIVSKKFPNILLPSIGVLKKK